jgi:hypothetical protein
MIPRWAVSVRAADSGSVAKLRLEPGIEALETADTLWLRGTASDERIDLLLRQLPDAARFDVLADGQLRPEGKRLPHGRMPPGPWISLQTLAKFELPVATLAALPAERMPFSCVRSATTEEANVLLTNIKVWQAFGSGAPQVRLQKLMFAVASDGRVIVRGMPLPPIAGERYYEHAGIALACGWGWPHWLDHGTVRAALDIDAEDLALFSPGGTWESIPGDQFVRATRSAIRMSGEVDSLQGGTRDEAQPHRYSPP